jgi:hypothetical protein
MYKRAQAEARRQGISLAELVRRALAKELTEQEPSESKPWMRFSGAISEGVADDSDNERVDALVYGRRP